MQSVIDKIKKIDTILKECKDDVEYSFWCPRDFTNPQGKGFTLYIYGGHVLDIFVDEAKNIYCKAFHWMQVISFICRLKVVTIDYQMMHMVLFCSLKITKGEKN